MKTTEYIYKKLIEKLETLSELEYTEENITNFLKYHKKDLDSHILYIERTLKKEEKLLRENNLK